LTALVATSNSLTGTLPPEWAELPSLVALDLNTNLLNGTLPAAWGRLSSLMYVVLSNNQLSGTLPPTWRTAWINVAWNNLTGPLPSSWSANRILELAGNNFSGSIPPSWGNAALQSLSLNDNPRLQGCLPRAWRSRAAFTLFTTRPGMLVVWTRRNVQGRAQLAADAYRADSVAALGDAGVGPDPETNHKGGEAVDTALKGTGIRDYC